MIVDTARTTGIKTCGVGASSVVRLTLSITSQAQAQKTSSDIERKRSQKGLLCRVTRNEFETTGRERTHEVDAKIAHIRQTAMRELNDFDKQMISHAERRGEVHVDVKGMTRRATLVAWAPKDKRGVRQRNRARVQFTSGQRATVKTDTITAIGAQ